MKSLNYRHVHVDFHTSEHIPDVGAGFDKEQFKNALIAGHVNSITLFSKCHFGWAYHPSTANEMHPSLKFDLLGAQLEACRELGVTAFVYLSAGYDEKYARRHIDQLVKYSPGAGSDFLTEAKYHLLCYNTPYLDYLMAQIEEVMQRYNPSGIFLDISYPRPCYCPYCLESMKKKGLDPRSSADVRLHARMVDEEYIRRTEEIVHKYNPEATIVHNGGHVPTGGRKMAHHNSHLEFEGLPTAGRPGSHYDQFPLGVAYYRTLGMEMTNMTAKFHKSWGEFGGFKHPNALRYETSVTIAEGAKCSIGDQPHPSGEMDMSTYRLIGKAYEEIEAKEPYVRNAEHITDIAVLGAKAYRPDINNENPHDMGALRILNEGKYQFNIIDLEENFEKYKLLILPDIIRVDENLRRKLDSFLEKGGKLLCSGESGLKPDCDEFAIDLGAVCEGASEFCPNYMIPEFECVNGRTTYVMYTPSINIRATHAKVAALMEDTYFNRTPDHFASHKHTPNVVGKDHDGAVLTSNTGCIAWRVFEDYATSASYHLRELIFHMIDSLLDKPSIRVNLPDRGLAKLTYQPYENRFVAHLLFSYTSMRGNDVEVICDTVPLCDIKAEIRVPSEPKAVRKVWYEGGKLNEEPLEYRYLDGVADISVGKFELHAMVVIDM